MQVHVKTRHIKIDIEGDIPSGLIVLLKEHYGKKVRFVNDRDDELVDVFETDWYKRISAKTSAGDAMRIYREIHKMTQGELGEKLGGVSRQNISHMERGIRPISLRTAKKLAKIFDVFVGDFIDSE